MLTPPFTALLRHLAAGYASLGRPVKLAPLTFEFQVSNNLFEYSTTGGRFLLKVMAHPQALYGQQDEAMVRLFECQFNQPVIQKRLPQLAGRL